MKLPTDNMHTLNVPLQTTRERSTKVVLGAPIDVITASQAVAQISQWASKHESKIVCICNVHSVVTATQDSNYMGVIQRAELTTPDGAPIAWMLRRLGAKGQRRVCGPDLMTNYIEHAVETRQAIFLLGSTPQTLNTLQSNLLAQWPTLRIVGAISPPFRPINEAEDEEIVRQINESGAGTVWISLGCPKQELWMDAHRGRVNAVMVGVGAAFDFHAGTTQRAPKWMRDNSLEWLHRLASEPQRLWKRYAVTNSTFIWLAACQLMRVNRDS